VSPLSQVALVLVVLVLLNQLMMRFTSLWKHGWLFWPLQAINIAVSVAILVKGLPLIEDKTATWVVGGLFLLRTVFNVTQRNDLFSAEREQEREVEYQRLQAQMTDQGSSDPDDPSSAD
jgi:hypothetical protein